MALAPPLVWLLLAALALVLVVLGADSDGLLLVLGVCALVLVLATSLVPALSTAAQHRSHHPPTGGCMGRQ